MGIMGTFLIMGNAGFISSTVVSPIPELRGSSEECPWPGTPWWTLGSASWRPDRPLRGASAPIETGSHAAVI